jgi:hypothetical protein
MFHGNLGSTWIKLDGPCSVMSFPDDDGLCSVMMGLAA